MSLRTINPTLGQHIQCLSNKGILSIDVTHIGEPDSVLLSPCCEHGFRAVYSARPKIDFLRSASALNENTLATRRELNAALSAATTEEARAVILGQLADQQGTGEAGYAAEGGWNWTDSSGADQSSFFTERQVSGLNGSWVLIAGAKIDDSTGFPTDAKAKWWASTGQGDASILEDLTRSNDYYGRYGGNPSETFRRWVPGTVTSDSPLNNGRSALNIDPSGSVLGEESSLPNPYRGNEQSRPYRGFRPQEIYWVLYGERTFEGIVGCQDPTGILPHTSHGDGDNWSGTTLIDPEVSGLISPTQTATGGYRPKIVFYGGDIQGAAGTSIVDGDGNITGVTMDDPGTTVITHTNDNAIEAPNVTVDMPLHYNQFNAKAEVTTDPQEIKSLLGDALFRDKASMLAEVCDGYNDPIAQTFMISPDAHEDGVFVPRIDLCFKTKPPYGSPTLNPVYVEIRPTVNGHPDSEKVIAYKILQYDDVNVASGTVPNGTSLNPWDDPIQAFSGSTRTDFFPSFDNADSYTSVTFDTPVYLSPGEYAIVIRSNDSAYSCWIADINGHVVNSNESLADFGATTIPDIQTTTNIQQYGGVFFRSSNGRTWNANQEQDLMFKVHKCVFGGAGTFSLGGSKITTAFDYHRLDLKTNSIFNPNPNSTEMSANLKTKPEGGTLSELTGISGNLIGQRADAKTRDMSKTMTYGPASVPSTSDIQLDYTLTSSNPDVSPIVDTRHLFAIPYKNDINDGAIIPSAVKILDGGTGYTIGLETFTISGGGSKSDAIVTVASTDSGVITGFNVTTPGSGFHKFEHDDGSPEIDQITITQNAGGSGTGADLEVLSEESSDGGNSKMRYITKNIDLAPGMEARAIKVFLSGKEPVGSNIFVYYKVRSREDREDIKFKKWRIMERSGPDQDFFTPSLSPIAGSQGDSVTEYEFDTDPVVTYTDSDNNAHETFASFSLKIVGQASNPAQPPVINNMRAVAVF